MDRILFLDNSIKNDLYKPLSYWESVLLFDFDSYRASAGEFPHDLDDYSHIFISGSTASVLESSDWVTTEQELIRTGSPTSTLQKIIPKTQDGLFRL